MKRTNISNNVIRRLPRYLRKLDDLASKGEERISSGELGRQMGLTPSQIRQDFSCFGEFGQQGYGYNIDSLRLEIGQILGTNREYSAILVGPGHLGTALMENFKYIIDGYTFLGAFDIRPEMIGTTVGGYPIYDIATMGDFVREHKVDFAILTVPREVAQELTDVLLAAGIRAIWNFTNVELDLGDTDTLVENIHFADSMLVLTYRLAEKDDTKQ
jgi:redox-sensing transcriptional repressor